MRAGTLWSAVLLAIAALSPAGRSRGDEPPPPVDLEKLKQNVEGISPEGRPKNYRLGEPARTYIWHDDDGWHIRSSSAGKSMVRFRGTLKLHGAKINAIRPVGLEAKYDKWSVSKEKDVITYDILTADSFDGLDFNLAADKESLIEFETHVGARKNLDRIFIGQKGANPRDLRFALPAAP